MFYLGSFLRFARFSLIYSVDLEAYFVENFQKVYAAPTQIDEFFAKSEFDIAALAEKTQAASGQPTDVVDFGALMMVSIQCSCTYKNDILGRY